MKKNCFRWLGFRRIGPLLAVLSLSFAPLTAWAQEREPNDTCAAAQTLPSSPPFLVTGSLHAPSDIDFYRITLTPGSPLQISLQGMSFGHGTLVDPVLGVFADDCVTILASMDDVANVVGLDPLVDMVMPASGTIVLAATGYPDLSFTGDGYYSGSYRLTIEEGEPAVSVSSRVVDAETGSPVHDIAAELTRCRAGSCEEYIGGVFSGPDGEVLIENGVNTHTPLFPGEYLITIPRRNHEMAQVGPFSLFSGQVLDLGEIALTRRPMAQSVRGRIVDGVTGEPLPSTTWVWVELLSCNPYCTTVAGTTVGPDGTFRMEPEAYRPFFAGTYALRVEADQYEQTQSRTFYMRDGEHLDFGDFGVRSRPIRIYLDKACDQIPAHGGKCKFQMRVVNGSPSQFTGEAWSLVYGGPTGSPAEYTTFQPGVSQKVSLAPGASAVVPASFFVPADVSNGAYICAWGFAARSPHTFNTLGTHHLFCVVKGAYGFSPVPEERKREADRRSKGLPPRSGGLPR